MEYFSKRKETLINKTDEIKKDLFQYISELEKLIYDKNKIIDEYKLEIKRLKIKICDLAEENNNFKLEIKNKQEIIDKLNKVEKEDNFTLEYLRTYTVDKVYILKGDTANCPNCFKNLKESLVDVAYFHKDDLNKINGYMNYKINYCSFCDYAFVNNEQMRIMINETKPDRIKYVNLTNQIIEEDIVETKDLYEPILLMESVKKNGNVIEIDELITDIIKKCRSKKLNLNNDLNKFKILFNKFLSIKLEEKNRNGEGVYNLVELAYQQIVLKDFYLGENKAFRKIEKIILNSSENKDKFKLSILLSKIYLTYFDQNKCRVWVEDILKHNLLDKSSLTNKELIDFLYIGLLVDIDDKVVCKVENMDSILSTNLKEVQVYNKYYELSEKEYIEKENLEKLIKLLVEMNLIDVIIKEKSVKFISEKLNKINMRYNSRSTGKSNNIEANKGKYSIESMIAKKERGEELTDLEEDCLKDSRSSQKLSDCATCINSCYTENKKFCSKYSRQNMNAAIIRNKVGAVNAIKGK